MAIVGYISSWGITNITGLLSNYPWDKVDYVLFSAIYPTSGSDTTLTTLLDPPWTPLTTVISTVHAAGKQVLASLGEAVNGDLDTILADGTTLRPSLIANLGSLVADCNLDGIDVDWEQASWQGDHTTKVNNLLSDLKTALPAGKIISMYSKEAAKTDCTTAALTNLDFISLGWLGAITGFQNAISYWIGQGFTASKMVMILPQYGYDDTYSPKCTWDDILHNIAPADNVNGTSLGSASSTIYPPTTAISGGVLMWSGVDYQEEVVRYSKALGLKGVGFWEVGFDALGDGGALINTLYEEVTVATEILRPNAAGDYNLIYNPINDRGTHYLLVDDVTSDGTATQIGEVRNAWYYDAFNLGTSSIPATATINSAAVYYVWQSLQVDAGNIGWAQPGLRLGGTDSLGTQVAAANTNWNTTSETISRPGGGSWAVADLVDLQVVLGLYTDHNAINYVNCTQIWVVADYTPKAVSHGWCSK